MFGNVDIEKKKCYCNKISNFWKDVDIEKVLVSNKIYFHKKNYKYFIGYLYDHEVKVLHTMLPKTKPYVSAKKLR